jgi:hypothetical protein
MSQQTINVGASPNDGTGTPLRTAFQYTNSNFTELYTATGPSGNNIVVPGNATITGDLTVDTSTLKVDSTNDRVGIGTASPAQFVHLSKSNTSTALTSPPVGGASLRIQNTSSTNNNFGSVEFYNAAGLFGASVNCQHTNQATPTNDLVFVTRGTLGGQEHYRIAADGVATWSEVGGVAGTAMTLNSTGLGVGVAPSAWGGGGKAFEIGFIGTGIQSRNNQYATWTQNAWYNSSAQWVYGASGLASRYDQDAGTHKWFIAPSGTGGLSVGFTQAMTLDGGGNLLVGTASAAGKITALAGASGQAAVFQQPAQNFWCVLAHNQATSGDNSFVLFGTEASFTSRGSITYNRAAGQVAYNITSDYRLKEDIKPLTLSLIHI